ncbi:MAG TPA: ATP-binding protein, partial [Blastocatellia bacterium]|nr:ATP-binding protein [Blastocatellia bacterium]
LTLEVSNRLIYQDGKPVAFQGIARDITERKNLQLQLAQTEKLSALGQLVSGVAHELNNPLTSVIGHVQLLLRSEVPRAFKDRLAIVGREGERARRIVQNLLSFARQHNPCRQEVDINALLDTTLELRAYDVATANITLEREYGRIPKTFADEHQLQQVFLNILINAEQSIGHDGGKGTIRIKTGVAPGPKHDGAPGGDSANRIVISITDDGPGISDEALGRVFDPFFTTKPVGMGTGLGLSITYGIIQEHKGTIKVESQPGHGACFTIELPVQVEF